jgi:hypothetical protein
MMISVIPGRLVAPLMLVTSSGRWQWWWWWDIVSGEMHHSLRGAVVWSDGLLSLVDHTGWGLLRLVDNPIRLVLVEVLEDSGLLGLSSVAFLRSTSIGFCRLGGRLRCRRLLLLPHAGRIGGVAWGNLVPNRSFSAVVVVGDVVKFAEFVFVDFDRDCVRVVIAALLQFVDDACRVYMLRFFVSMWAGSTVR